MCKPRNILMVTTTLRLSDHIWEIAKIKSIKRKMDLQDYIADLIQKDNPDEKLVSHAVTNEVEQ